MSNIELQNQQYDYSVEILSEADTENFAKILTPFLTAPIWVALEGSLGVGKTTLTRYVLRQLGHLGSVKSPTYTLVEPYKVRLADFYHFDLYRLGEPEELDYLGIRDYIHNDTVAFVEWPSKGKGFLPQADLKITLTMDTQQKHVVKRIFNLKAFTKTGLRIVKGIEKILGNKHEA